MSVTRSKLRRVGAVPAHLAHAAHKINRVVDLHVNKTGLIIGDGKTIVVKRLPDGRYDISLHPKIRDLFPQ